MSIPKCTKIIISKCTFVIINYCYFSYFPLILQFSKWGEVFSDITIANAILDRLIHHSSIIKITGHSYRLKGKVDC